MSAQNAERQEKRRDMMLNTPIPKLIPKMAVPTIISMLVMSFYNMADTFFVASLGDAATGAVGVNMSLMSFIQMWGMAIAVGANSYISRLLGAKRDEEATQTLSTAFVSAFAIGTVMMVGGLVFMGPLMKMLGAETTEILKYSTDYASYILYAAPFMTASFVLNQCLRAEGNATFSMIGMVAGAVINIVLDPIFIFVFGWEVKGAAAATAISQIISFCILLVPYLKKKSLLHLHFSKIKFSKTIVTEVCKMGFPSLMRIGLTTIATVITNRVAIGFSGEALAAISVVNRIMMFVTSAILGFGQGYQPVCGFNWGAKRFDRVTEAFRFTATTGTAVMVVFSLCVAIFAEPIMRAFSSTPETIAVGVFSIRLQCLAMPIHAWCIVVNMTYTATGKAASAAILALSRQGIFFIPAVAALPMLFGVNGLASAQAVADILSFVLALPLANRVLNEARRNAIECGQPTPTLAEWAFKRRSNA